MYGPECHTKPAGLKEVHSDLLEPDDAAALDQVWHIPAQLHAQAPVLIFRPEEQPSTVLCALVAVL